MTSCLEQFNNTLVGDTNVTWGQLDRTTLAGFKYSSYFRPDVGGALLPWAYTIGFFAIHLPVVIVRVARFDIVQWFSIASALLAVYLAIQEYVSTGFADNKILSWAPLLLVIDAGAMLQVFFLVIEARVYKVGRRTIMLERGDAPEGIVTPPPLSAQIRSRFSATFSSAGSSPAATTTNMEEVRRRGPRSGSRGNSQTPLRPDQIRASSEDPGGRQALALAPAPEAAQEMGSRVPAVIAAVISAILFFAILALQILGLVESWKRHNPQVPPLVPWCSPSFQPFSVAVLDGNCNVYLVDQRDQQGIGCIQLQGYWQQHWLLGTGVGTLICIILEFVDALILGLVNGEKRFHWVKMKRPWSTMISGVVVLGVTLIYGIQYAQTLPFGITERVTIVVDVGHPMAFDGTLTTAGLRGTILAWSDGLFSSWGTTYFGI